MRALVCSAFVLVACTESPDCPLGAVLVEGSCRTGCTTASECLSGERCENGACLPGGAPSDAGPTDRGTNPGTDASAQDAAPPDAEDDAGQMECRGPDDCPPPSSSEWGPCVSVTPCGFDGQRQRTVMVFDCQGGKCVPSMAMESEGCQLDTEGMVCGPSRKVRVGPCGPADPLDPCASMGLEQHHWEDLFCRSGQCRAEPRMEGQSCARTTEGDSCGMRSEGPWGPCRTELCSGRGERSREVIVPTCRANTCALETVVETDSTTCFTGPGLPDGSSCGPTAVCCLQVCTRFDTTSTCGACGVSCAQNQQCVSVTGTGIQTYTCTCNADSECTTGGGCNNMSQCECECPNGQGPCTGPTLCGGAGVCHDGMTAAFCTPS